MNNASKHDFTPIHSEEFREYTFVLAPEKGDQPAKVVKIRIDQPTHLSVSASGGHRLLDAAGISHYIPSGWLQLSWKPKPGEPNFVA